MTETETIQIAMARAGLNAKVAICMAVSDFVAVSVDKANEQCSADAAELRTLPELRVRAAAGCKSDVLPAVPAKA